MNSYFKSLIVILCIFNYYFWLATSGTYIFDINPKGLMPKETIISPQYYSGVGKHGTTAYNALAEGFLKGQLHLPVVLPKGLLSLENKYDNKANLDYRSLGFQDISVYKDSVYIYFGPVPAIVLYIPFIFLFKQIMPDSLAVLIFSFGIFLWSIAIIFYLKKRYAPASPSSVVLIMILLAGFANASGSLLNRPLVYEVAIAAGYFFFIGSIYFLLKAYDKNLDNLFYITISSLFLGLSFGARPNTLLASLFIILVCLSFYFKIHKKISLNYLLALFIPFITCLLLIALYNYLRFGDIAEFGMKYQLGRNAQPIIHDIQLNLNNLISNLDRYLCRAPKFDSNFPYVHITSWSGRSKTEYIVGLLTGVPFVVLSILSFPFLKSFKFPLFEFLITFVSGLINLSFFITKTYVAIRYMADFATLFILSSCTTWFYFESYLENKSFKKKFFNTLVFSLSWVSICFGYAFSLHYGLELR